MTSTDDVPDFNMDGLNQEDFGRQDQQDDLYLQNGNYGIGHMSGGVVQDGAQVIGKSIKEEKNQSQNLDVQLNVNIGTKSESIFPQEPINSNPRKKVLFEIRISGELIENKRAKYRNVQRRIEDIVDEVNSELPLDCNVSLKYLDKGSIRIGLEGYSEDFNTLQKLFKTGKLSEILDIPIEDISLVFAEDLNESEIMEVDEKSRLIEEIKIRNAKDSNSTGFKLIRADLSGTNLKYADLKHADLFNANLEYAELEYTDLRNANLEYANLRHANLKYADLRHANLRYTNLKNANLNGANVENTYFVGSLGISELLQQNLTARGAIFKDSPEEHSGVLSHG